MAELQLYVRSDVPAFEYDVDLEGRTYHLALYWNPRAELWHMNIFTDARVPLVLGLPLVSNFPLLLSYRSILELPPGEMVMVDLAGEGASATRDNLGTRVQLLYYESATVQELNAARSVPAS